MSKTLTKLVLTLTIVVLVLTVVEWGCLQDILHDYASPKVLREHTNVDPGSLPEWTAAPQEWSIVMGALYARALSLGGVAVLLAWATFRGART